MKIWILPVAFTALSLAMVLVLIAAAVNGQGPGDCIGERCQNGFGCWGGDGACDLEGSGGQYGLSNGSGNVACGSQRANCVNGSGCECDGGHRGTGWVL
ncbi:MAG: hypothetical protein JW986_07700 [Methanotrichaceae archaeon]|nr:hypothetical protein [Methanotrichaceae archaeon]